MMTRQQTIQRKVLRKVKKNWVTVAAAGLIASNFIAPTTASAQTWTARAPEQIAESVGSPSTIDNLGTYNVVWGDTLWGLSMATGFNISEFVQVFGIENPDLILAGKTLNGQGATQTVQDVKTYTVVAGDTLSSIARAFNTTVERLVALNDIENANLIFVGDLLNLQAIEEAPSESVKENTKAPSKSDEKPVNEEQPSNPDEAPVEEEQPSNPDEESVEEEQPSNPDEAPVEEEQPSNPDEAPVEEEQPSNPDEDVLTKEEQFINDIKEAFPDVAEHFTFGDAQSRDVEENLDVYLSITWENLRENSFESRDEAEKVSADIEAYINNAGLEYFVGKGMVEHIFFIDVD